LSPATLFAAATRLQPVYPTILAMGDTPRTTGGKNLMLRSRLRVLVALCFALTSVAAFAAPASAETILSPCSGTCGSWEVYDGETGRKGANGIYATSFPYELNKITVRPPLMHGDHPSNSQVGWRFKIQRMPVGGGSWVTRYTSTYQTAQADNAIPAYAGNGFSRRSWLAPNNPSGFFYRVVIDMRWKHNGLVEGRLSLKYDWYKAKSGTNTYTNPDYLLASY
jgi:hypothetical protein